MDNGGCFIKYLSKHEKMKQTAIDWLLENLITEPFSEEHFEYNNNCLDKAKEMEKEQIIEAFKEGFTEGCRYTTGFEQTLWEYEEDYYNETYKK